jgi:DHA1 family bicyclomycin/chloramphenicol resistance-like MFS transporter
MRIRPESLAFTILLGSLAALPPLSIDMGLPALGLLESSLNATPSQATLTLSLFLAGFAVAQLLAGPLSDRYGRRPIMLGGLSLYAVSSLCCAAAPSIGVLLGFRLLAGMGAAGATTLALAVARDVFQGHVARVRMSSITMVITIAPIVAPTIGGLMLSLGGWRFIYGLLAASGCLLFLLVGVLLPETRVAQSGTRLDLIGRYGVVLRTPRTMGYAVVAAMGSGSLFAFIANSPGVLMGRMGASPTLFGALFAVTSGGILLGSSLNSLLARRRVPANIPLTLGMILAPLSGIGASLFLLAGYERLETFVPFIVLTGICRGLVNPNCTYAALEPLPNHAGSASALLGCGQMLMAAASGAVVGALYPALGTLAVSVAITGFGLAALIGWVIVERRWPAREA